MALAKIPESFEKICWLQVGQISHFILWSNARYDALCKTIRTESILLRSDYDTPSHMNFYIGQRTVLIQWTRTTLHALVCSGRSAVARGTAACARLLAREHRRPVGSRLWTRANRETSGDFSFRVSEPARQRQGRRWVLPTTMMMLCVACWFATYNDNTK